MRSPHLHTVSRFFLSTTALLPATRLRTGWRPTPSDAIPGLESVAGPRELSTAPVRQGTTSCLRPSVCEGYRGRSTEGGARKL